MWASVLGDPFFERNTEAISDPVGVGEVRDNFCDMEDVGVGESLASKRCDIGLGYGGRLTGEFLGISQHSDALSGEARRRIILLDAGGEVIITEQTAQTAPVMGNSVMALVDPGNDNSNHLPLYLAKCPRATHCLPVEHVMSFEAPRVERMDPHHPIDPVPFRVEKPILQSGEVSLPLVFVRGICSVRLIWLVRDGEGEVQPASDPKHRGRRDACAAGPYQDVDQIHGGSVTGNPGHSAQPMGVGMPPPQDIERPDWWVRAFRRFATWSG